MTRYEHWSICETLGCSRFFSLLAGPQCHAQLKVFDEAVKELQAGKAPVEVCRDLKYCTAGEQAPALAQVPFLWDQVKSSRCATCKQNTFLLASMATKPESVQTFLSSVKNVCRLIPESDECELLMKHHDLILDALHKGESIETICEKIHACPEEVTVASDEASINVSCLLCEYTAEVLERTNTSEKEVRLEKKALETIKNENRFNRSLAMKFMLS